MVHLMLNTWKLMMVAPQNIVILSNHPFMYIESNHFEVRPRKEIQTLEYYFGYITYPRGVILMKALVYKGGFGKMIFGFYLAC